MNCLVPVENLFAYHLLRTQRKRIGRLEFI